MQLKKDCMHRLNFLKVISHMHWGSDRVIMLRLYRSIIRSKLDYGSIFYSSAKPSTLKLLDPVHNTAIIRLCTGAFRSSPVVSLYADSGEPPLELRRVQLLLQFYVRAQQLPSYPTLTYVQPTAPSQNASHSLLISEQLHNALHSAGFAELPVMPFKFVGTPWGLAGDVFCCGFDCPIKRNALPQLLLELFNQHCHQYHRNSQHIFTDGSKDDTSVGFAAVLGADSLSAKLPQTASKITAELLGAISALYLISDSPENTFTMFTDSKSVLQALHHYDSTHPLILRTILLILKVTAQQKYVTLCWCPSHVGVVGNERADREAVSAAQTGETLDHRWLPYRDYYPAIKTSIRTIWNRQWFENPPNKLRTIKDNTSTWLSSNHKQRKISVIITRLRIGHTQFSHSHLMSQSPPPVCSFCNAAQQTVRHVLAECPAIEHTRRRYFPTLPHAHTDASARAHSG